jgi:hypothetical protein
MKSRASSIWRIGMALILRIKRFDSGDQRTRILDR